MTKPILENYTTIEEGFWNGVSYRINNAEVVEEADGACKIMLDYDVKNLEDRNSQEFESFLGSLIEAAIEKELDRIEEIKKDEL